jgi:hypothetical protein
MSTPLITLDALKESVEARTAKETADKTALVDMFDTTKNGLVDKLHMWAGLGFPEGYTVLSTPVTPPTTCLDGVVRTLPDYVAYLLGGEIGRSVTALQAQVAGITLGWSMPNGVVQVGATAQ